ncbi:MAG TPA: sulfotransferase domain-containing protein [Sphingomicrobium sp.]|nr:sulfotransferase domain-containing protein [Sphingomicrobium sp.]
MLRLVPGSAALRIKRDLRDGAWLAEAEAVVVSYPKSGRTFVRAMLARLYQRRFGVDERGLLEFPMLLRAPAEVPRVLFTHAGDAMRRPDQIGLDPSDYAGRKVVLIARHPGDIAVSRYHHLKHRSRDKARRRLAEQPLDAFVWADEGGIPSIVAFLNRFAALPGVTIIRYEDFLAQPEASLRTLADALGLGVDTDGIADAVEFARLPNLKEREREGYFTSPRLRRARTGDAQSGKVRSGTSGGYRAQLDPATAARIDEFVSGNLDPRLGYSAGG